MAIRPFANIPYQWKNRVMLQFDASDYWWNSKTASSYVGNDRFIINTTGSQIIKTHLRENIELSANTQFQSLIDMTPLGNIVDTIQNYSAGVFGKAFGGIGKFFQVETWKSTDPLSFPLTFRFDTLTSSWQDVMLPSIALFGYTVPEETQDKILTTPGPNLFTTLQYYNEEQKSAKDIRVNADSKARLITILIGGWLYLSGCVLQKAEPTFSKDLTEAGYPLWSELSIEIKTLKTTTLDLLVGMGVDAQSMNTTGLTGI